MDCRDGWFYKLVPTIFLAKILIVNSNAFNPNCIFNFSENQLLVEQVTI